MKATTTIASRISHTRPSNGTISSAPPKPAKPRTTIAPNTISAAIRISIRSGDSGRSRDHHGQHVEQLGRRVFGEWNPLVQRPDPDAGRAAVLAGTVAHVIS